MSVQVWYSFLILLGTSVSAQSFNQVLEANFTGHTYATSSCADVDNDGDHDVLVCGSNNASVRFTTLYRNNLDSTFTDLVAGFTGVNVGSVDWEDFDRDGDVDLLLSGSSASGKVLLIYSNNSGLFTQSHNLIGISSGTARWIDLERDGDMDIIAIGNGTSGNVALVYENENGTFTSISNTLTALSGVALETGDFTGDGYEDILVCGLDALSSKTTAMYRNNRNKTFTALSIVGLPQVSNGAIAVADVDNDSDLDFAICGTDNFSTRILKVFLNQGNNIVLNSWSGTGISSASIQFGDYDNDGDPDLFSLGNDGSSVVTSVWANNGVGVFTNISAPLIGQHSGGLALSDFDKDGDLDLFTSGQDVSSPLCKLYRNRTATVNALPSIPTTLIETTQEDSATLSWDAATDANGGTLSYNIFIGTSKTTQNILSSNSDLNNGFRKIVALGNTGHKSTFTIHDLPQGKYYWSVQAIDNSYAASSFAPVDSFVICRKFSIGNDTVLCEGDAINLSAGVSGDEVNWYSTSTPVIATNALSISHPIIVTDTIWAQRFNAISGCLTYDTIQIQANILPSINAGLDSSICLGSSLVLGGTPTASSSIFTNTYKWYPSYGLNDSTLANPTASPLVDTTYYVIVKSGVCEADTSDIQITIDPLPTVNASADTVIGYGQVVNLEATGAISYSWTPSLSLTGPLTATPQAKPEETTLYVVTGTDANGCSDTANVKVSVENRFFIPDLFSPDGDGNNDIFLVYGVGIKQLTLRIYNQSGLEVFSSSDVTELTEIGWDGMQNGKALHGQAFLWTMEGTFADGSAVSYKGKKTGTLILKR